MMTSGPSRYGLFNNFSKYGAYQTRVDGEDGKDDVGVLWRKRGLQGRLKFTASAIGSWLELWRLILVIIFKKLVLFVYREDWM